MTQPILDRIARATGVPGLLDLLSTRLTPTDLQSLLLAVYHARAARQTPARVLDQYRHNRFVRPAAVDLRTRLAVDALALRCVPAFAALDLAPVAPLGTTSALAPVDQNTVVATSRNTEVVSDSTNVLALECAERRRAQRAAGADPAARVRLCTSQRLTRAQNYGRPGLQAHFQIFALCTAGRAGAGYGAELAMLGEQLTGWLTFLAALPEIGYPAPAVRVVLTDLTDPAFAARLPDALLIPLAARFPAAQLEFEPDRITGAGYYELARYHIYATTAAGTEHELADGGFTNWTQQLLGDRKERLLISGLGTERICTLFRPAPEPG